MPDPTPLPVVVVELSGQAADHWNNAQAFAEMALAFGAGAMLVLVVLLTTIAVVTGLRR